MAVAATEALPWFTVVFNAGSKSGERRKDFYAPVSFIGDASSTCDRSVLMTMLCAPAPMRLLFNWLFKLRLFLLPYLRFERFRCSVFIVRLSIMAT